MNKTISELDYELRVLEVKKLERDLSPDKSMEQYAILDQIGCLSDLVETSIIDEKEGYSEETTYKNFFDESELIIIKLKILKLIKMLPTHEKTSQL